MTTQQPEALRLAGLLELAPEDGVEPQTAEDAAAELRRLHSENETLQAGYAAARLEIESLQARIKTMAEEHADELMVAHLDGRMRAAQPAGAQQPTTQPAPQPSPTPQADSQPAPHSEPWYGHQFKEVRRGYWQCSCGKAIAEAVPSAGKDSYPPLPNRYAYDDDGGEMFTADHMRAYADAAHAMRASHGQAPAQAAPACKDSTPELHVGDSAFESWYSAYNPAHKSDKQRAHDAYAAGMGDPLVMAAPAAVAVPTFEDFCKRHGLDPKKMDGHGGMWARVALDECRAITNQPAPQQEAQEPYSIDADPQGIRALVADAITGALAFGAQGTNAPPDGHWLAPFWAAARAESEAAPQPSPASHGNGLDTARLDWLDKNIFHRDMDEWDARYGHGDGYNMWVLFAPKGAQGSARNIIDAARKQGANHD